MVDERLRSGLEAGADSSAEARWGAMTAVVPGYLVVADPEGTITYLNRVPPGRQLEEFLGRKLTAFVDVDQRDLLGEAVSRTMSGGAGAVLEARSAISGRWLRVRLSGIRDRGRTQGLVAHVADIDDASKPTAHERQLEPAGAPDSDPGQQDSIRHTIRRLYLMADSLPLLVSYVDAQRRYQYNNAAYTRWFGRSREQLRGRTMEEVLGAEAYRRIRGYVDAALGGRTVSFETTVPYKEAGERRVVANYVPDVGEDGHVQGFYVLVEDVSERYRTEEALRQREDELRQLQKMEALGRLTGGIAHDFNNLMQTILNACSWALHRLKDLDAEATESISQINGAAARGASLTRQLLTFSRGSTLAAQPIHLDVLVADMELLVDHLVGPAIDVETDLRASCRIMADAGQMQQIILNLAINARDAMPEGGCLQLQTRRVQVEQARAALPSMLQPGPYGLLTVSDTGIGMDAATLARAFEPFFTTKPPELGTGLGLSTVYGIVQSLDGAIEVESSVGRGTAFHLYLPCAGV